MLISLKGCLGVFLLILVILCVIGLVQSIHTLLPVVLPRITGNIPVHQEVFFSPQLGFIDTIVEVPSEIRPGSSFQLMLRGAEYINLDIPVTIIYRITTTDIQYIQSISPSIVTVSAGINSDWILEPQEVVIRTINPEILPESIKLDISQEVTKQEGTVVSDLYSISIAIDKTPFPTLDLVKGILSLIGLLLGAIGGVKVTIG